MLERIELTVLFLLESAINMSATQLCFTVAFFGIGLFLVFIVLPAKKKTVSEIKIQEALAKARAQTEDQPLMTGTFVLSDEKSDNELQSIDNFKIPVTAKKSFLDAKDQVFFQHIDQYARGRFHVIPHVALSRIVTTTEKSVSVHLLKRLRTNGVQFILVDRYSLKIRLAVSLQTKLNADALIFIKEVLVAAAIPHVTFDRDAFYSSDDIESLLNTKLLPSSARLNTGKTG